MRTLLLHVTISLFLLLSITGCFFDSENDSTPKIFEAPLIENLPEATKEESVTITLRTRPNADIYLNKTKVATSDDTGVAHIKLIMQDDKEISEFELLVRDKKMRSETLFFSIKKEKIKQEESSSSQTTLQISSSSFSSTVTISSSSDNASSSSVETTLVVPVISSSSSSVNSVTVVNSSSTSSSSVISSEASSSSTVSVSSSSEASSSSQNSLQITQIKLSQTSIELPETNTTALHVNAHYDNNTSQTLTSSLQWIITNPEIVSIQNNTLKALKEGETTLKVRYKNFTSQSLHVSVYKIIQGYRLPPEPDEQINNSTLLGIDSNSNGVRDDVERWIYKTYDTYIPCVEEVVYVDVKLDNGEIKRVEGYKDVCEDKPIPYHQIVREAAMQGARAAQIIIQEPKRARETTELMHAALICDVYFSTAAERLNEPLLIPKDIYLIGKEFDAIQFNTVQRARAYGEYNFALSGGVYSANETDEEMRQACDFDVDALLGK